MKNSYNTKRLTLRTLKPNDYNMVLRFLKENKSYFEQYESKKPDNFYTDNFQYDTLAAESSFFDIGFFFRYYIFLKDDPRLIGTVSFKRNNVADSNVMTLGYKFDHRFWGMGYAYESISFLSDLIINEGCTDTLEAFVQPDNTRSIKLLNKLGFVHTDGDLTEYELPPGPAVHHIYHR